MTVASSTAKYVYAGDGTSVAFAFPSLFFLTNDILVGVNGVLQTTGYTVTGAGNPTGGTVTFSTAPASGAVVLLLRKPAFQQLVDFVNGQTVLEGTIETALDRLTMMSQYLLDALSRSLRVGDLDTLTATEDLLLPSATARAGKLLGFDTAGRPAPTSPSGSIAPGSISDTDLVDMAEAAVKGRAAGAGSGPPGNLTPAQLAAIVALGGGAAIDGANLNNGSVANSALADMAEATIKGRAAGAGPGVPGNLTAAQLRTIIGNFGAAVAGLTPASGGGTVNFLRADGAWASPGDIVLATQQATASGTQFDFTGLPAGLNEIVVAFDGVSLSGTDHLLVQLGTSGGIEATGYVSTSGLVFAGAAIQAANSTTGFVLFVGDATRSPSGQLIIRRMSGNKWTQSHANVHSTISIITGAGIKTLSGEIDRIRILATGANTFDAGSVNISYTR